MEAESFVASRWTRGNRLFPERIVVSDHSVLRRQRTWLSVNEESVHIRNVATVNITTGLVWSDLSIESSGGSDPITSHGHTKSDARRIKELIELLQERLASAAGAPATPAPDAADLRPCPHCAELVRKAARICRYCQRELD
jgi:hypothetical protein